MCVLWLRSHFSGRLCALPSRLGAECHLQGEAPLVVTSASIFAEVILEILDLGSPCLMMAENTHLPTSRGARQDFVLGQGSSNLEKIAFTTWGSVETSWRRGKSGRQEKRLEPSMAVCPCLSHFPVWS